MKTRFHKMFYFQHHSLSCFLLCFICYLSTSCFILFFTLETGELCPLTYLLLGRGFFWIVCYWLVRRLHKGKVCPRERYRLPGWYWRINDHWYTRSSWGKMRASTLDITLTPCHLFPKWIFFIWKISSQNSCFSVSG